MRRSLWVLPLIAMLAAACGSTPYVAAERTAVEIKQAPIVVVPPQVVVIDLDGDGTESVELDASASTDPDGVVVDYRWSQGLDDLAVTAVHSRQFDVGEHVVTLTVTDNDQLSDVRSMVVRVLEPYEATEGSPVIDLWLGSEFAVGDGEASRWVNVLGNVSDPDGVASLIWSLNGGAPESLSIIADDRRLVRTGDFTLDLLRSQLIEGANTVELRATDNQGEATTALVRIDNGDDPAPAFPVSVAWSSDTSLDGLVEVVDGHWKIKGDELVIDGDARGYDRLLALGDIGWTEFDVRTTVVVDEIGTEISPFSISPGFGMLLRWNGHNDSVAPGSQPQAGFRPDGGANITPFGGFPLYTWAGDLAVFEMQNHRGAVVGKDDEFIVEVGSRYNFRSQVQSIVGGTVYRSKLWLDGTDEPSEWSVTSVAGSSDFEPGSGSLVLVAHETEVRFGPVLISAIPEDDRLSDQEIELLRAEQI